MRRILGLALVILAVLVHAVARPRLLPAWPREVSPTIPAPDGLRVATWNLRNLGDDPDRDLDDLAARLARLDAAVLALQEIRDPTLLAGILPEHRVLVSEDGGRGGQHVALAYDPRQVSLVEGPIEDRRITEDGRVRPAMWARLRPVGGGPGLVVVVVHLKARPEGLAVRRRQWPTLARIVEAIPDDGDRKIVLGDFNATGPRTASPEVELDELATVLGTVGLHRIPDPAGCTAYWDGSRRDRWVEPSRLDLLWIDDADLGLVAHPAAHCARHRCRPFESSDAYPDPDLRQSDHCPVWVDL